MNTDAELDDRLDDERICTECGNDLAAQGIPVCTECAETTPQPWEWPRT